MSVVLEGVLEKRADVLRVWRSRWFALTEDGLLSYWMKAGSAPDDDRGMAKCTRQTRDITSVLSHEGFFAIDWKDGSTWNMRAPAGSSKQLHVNWVMQLKQMTVGAAFGRSPRAASASAVVAVGHGDCGNSDATGSNHIHSLNDDNSNDQKNGGARAVPVFRQMPPPPPERRDNDVATEASSCSSTSSSSLSSSSTPSSCSTSSSLVTSSTSSTTSASHVGGDPLPSHSLATQHDRRDQRSIDFESVPEEANAPVRHCPGCNSSRLRIKPICSACQGDGFFVVRETADKTDLLTRVKQGQLANMFQTISVHGATA